MGLSRSKTAQQYLLISFPRRGNQRLAFYILLYQLSYSRCFSANFGGIRTRDLGIKSAKYGRTTTPGGG